VDKIDKTEKNISFGTFLAKFFVGITIGGVFLSVGLVGLYRLADNRPLAISKTLLVACLLIGLFLDAIAISYLLNSKKHLFDDINQNNK
jgi:hypothetical protein